MALVAGLLTFVLAGAARAADEDKPASDAGEAKGGDKPLYDALREVIDRGADLYNGGDRAGCYRLYEGALMAAKAHLGRLPDLQKSIDAGLAEANQTTSISARAFACRRLLDEVRAKVNPNPKKKPEDLKPPADTAAEAVEPKTTKPAQPKPPAPAATLWDRLGGGKNVKKIVDDFVAIAAKDAKVNFTRGGRVKLDDTAVDHFKQMMVNFISQETGGPYEYTGKSMKEAHQGMGITDAEFDATAADLRQALEKNGVKAAEVKQVLQAAESTRTDIVEAKKPAQKKPEDKPKQENGDKKPADDKKPGDKPKKPGEDKTPPADKTFDPDKP
jgi:hemoglobin